MISTAPEVSWSTVGVKNSGSEDTRLSKWEQILVSSSAAETH